MLVSWIGDQALVVNDVLKFGKLYTSMVVIEYQHIVKVRQFKRRMKSNCPNKRLSITGEIVTVH